MSRLLEDPAAASAARPGKGGGALRAGTTALSLLSVPLNIHILTALEHEEVALGDLSGAVGHPPATTMRSYLKTLADLGVVERRQHGGFPGSVTYLLARPGSQLLLAASTLQNWLSEAPDGPIRLGEPAAKSAIKALVEGWSSTIIRVLAARPLALTELAKLIPSISYPTLERRLAALRRTGQLQACRDVSASRGTPYRITPWLRQAAAPLVAAVSWEREWAAAQTKALSRIDIEAIFLLAIPLLDLPEELSGRCRLAVEVRTGSQPEYAGAMVTVEAGKPASWAARLEGDSDAWAGGSASSWLGWMSGHDDQLLEFGGEKELAQELARAVADSLGRTLSSGREGPAAGRKSAPCTN
jgi:DNA-binding HxlR family transcriptional regulator